MRFLFKMLVACCLLVTSARTSPVLSFFALYDSPIAPLMNFDISKTDWGASGFDLSTDFIVKNVEF